MAGAATMSGSKAPAAAPAGSGGGLVPFFYGSNWYMEKFASDTVTLGTSQQEIVKNINPGGFLRGVRLEVSSTGGALGGGALAGDTPWAVIASATIENIDGSPILYPCPGYTYFLRQKYLRPWLYNPSLRGTFSNTVNPAFGLLLQTEIRHTAAVLANTDARALYRTRITVSTLAQYVTGGAPTGPAVTITQYLEAWAQPDAANLHGKSIEELPPGLNLAPIFRRQILGYQAAGASNTFQWSNTGNELRGALFISRNSSGVRTDLFSDPIRLRLDNRSLGTFSPRELQELMDDQAGASVQQARDTGVYVFHRWYDPGSMVGQAWLTTTNATYLILETITGAGGTNGTLEIATDEVVPTGRVPLEFESI